MSEKSICDTDFVFWKPLFSKLKLINIHDYYVSKIGWSINNGKVDSLIITLRQKQLAHVLTVTVRKKIATALVSAHVFEHTFSTVEIEKNNPIRAFLGEQYLGLFQFLDSSVPWWRNTRLFTNSK